VVGKGGDLPTQRPDYFSLSGRKEATLGWGRPNNTPVENIGREGCGVSDARRCTANSSKRPKGIDIMAVRERRGGGRGRDVGSFLFADAATRLSFFVGSQGGNVRDGVPNRSYLLVDLERRLRGNRHPI